MPLKSPDLLAVNALGQFAEHPRVAALRDFITGWYVSYLSTDSARGQPEAGPQERLTKSGDNLANVIQFLAERHGTQLERIFEVLRRRVPRIERVLAETMLDGRLLLQIKDAPFNQPVLARFASDGTLKLLAYLVLLYDPAPPPFVGIEEPENFLHPRLLPELAEECRAATERTQLMVTTHSPFFLNALRPEEVRVWWRNEQGYTQSQRAADLPGVPEFVARGALLGHLWMEGQLGVGDPLVNQGSPTRPNRGRKPRVPANIPRQAGYRKADAIRGGTWEAFERIVQRHGYFKAGLPKVESARMLGRLLDPARCNSMSFIRFHAAISEALP